MSEKKKEKLDFDKIWRDGREFRDSLEGIAEELFDYMKKTGTPEPIIIRFVNIFAQIDGLIDFLYKTKVGIDPFKRWHRNKFLKHKHKDGEVLVPEAEPDLRE